MDEAKAINAALGKAYGMLQSGKPLSIPVTVEDVDVAVEEATAMGLVAEAVDEQTVILLFNQPPAPARPQEVPAMTVVREPADVVLLIAQTQAAIDRTQAAIDSRRRWRANRRRFWLMVIVWTVALFVIGRFSSLAALTLGVLATIPFLVGGAHLAVRGDRP